MPSHHVEPEKPVSFQGTATGTSRIRPSAKTKGRETAIPSPANRAIEPRASSLSAQPRALTLYYTVSLLNWHFSTSNCVKSLPQIGQHLAVLPTLDQLAHWEGGKKADVNSLSSPCKSNIISVMLNSCKILMSDQDKDDDRNKDGGGDTGVIVETRPKTKKPSMYKVLMLNDDYTPMEFVVHVLERFFGMNTEQATEVMLHVHRRGVGICGVFSYEVAETKVTQVMDFARQHQHPLQCTLEKD